MECATGVCQCIMTFKFNIYKVLTPTKHLYSVLQDTNKLQVTTRTDWTQAVVHNLFEWFGHLGIPRHLSAALFKDL